EGRERLRALLALPGASEPTPERAKALQAASNLALEQADYTAVRLFRDESLAIWRKLGNKTYIAWTLRELGALADCQGDYTAAQSHYEDSLELFRELGDPWGMGFTLNSLTCVAQARGDHALARSLFEQSLAMVQKIESQKVRAALRYDLAG